MDEINELKFFSKRREMNIGDFQTYKEGANTRMLRVPISIPMANRPNDAVPEWILDGYQVVVKDDSKYGRMDAKKKQKLEGLSLTFFTSDTIKGKMNAGVKDAISGLHGCSIEKMYVERVGDGDKTEIYFHFTLKTMCNPDIVLWFYGMQGGSIFVEFDSTQASFKYDGEKKEEDEDDGQEKLSFDGAAPTGPKLVKDPNDTPKEPIPNDKRKVTKPTDKPSARSAPKKGSKKK